MKRIFLTSIPKCGTHLLLAFLERVGAVRHQLDARSYVSSLVEIHRIEGTAGWSNGGEIEGLRSVAEADRNEFIGKLSSAPPGAVVAAHCIFDPVLLQALRELDYVVVFMIRDPRDQVISYCNHVLKDPTHKNYARFKRQTRQATYCDLMRGATSELPLESNVSAVTRLYRNFEGWLNAAGVATLAFEHLVGAKGNGSRLRQLFEADRLTSLAAIGHDVDVDECLRVMFDETHSLFVKGQIGVWVDEFDSHAKEIFERECRPLLLPYLARIEDAPVGWDQYIVETDNVRRAWRLAERDLAAALASRYAVKTNAANLDRLLKHAWADSDKRLAVIRRLEARVRELQTMLQGQPRDAATPGGS